MFQWVRDLLGGGRDKGTPHITMGDDGEVTHNDGVLCEGHTPCRNSGDLYANHPSWAAGFDS